MGEFEGKVVLITGASSGFGAASALQFATGGASLALTGRNKEKLDAVCDECKVKGAKDVLAIIAEFTIMEEVKNVADKTIERFKKMDILINNAGTVAGSNLENSSMDDFDCMMNLNVKSLVYLTKILIPELVKTKGNIVNISSIAASHPITNANFYCMAKAAVDQFTKTLALEYAPKGVRVNSVKPSTVKTEITRNIPNWTQETSDNFFGSAHRLHPIGRIGVVEEVANAIVFLASDKSAWTTGQCLILDGARTLQVPQ